MSMYIIEHTNQTLKLEFKKIGSIDGFIANNILMNSISFRGIFLMGIITLEFWLYIILPMIGLKIICPPLFRFIVCLITKKSIYSYTFDKLSNKLHIKYKKIFGEYFLEEEKDLADIKEIEAHETTDDRGKRNMNANLILNTGKKLPLSLFEDIDISRSTVKKINQFLNIDE